jgi:hypothetical protein
MVYYDIQNNKGNVMEKDIKGYEGLYTISDEGFVYRKYKSGAVKSIGGQNGDGYIKATLSKPGIPARQVLVHRLVAEYFIPNPESLPMVDHRNEDKTDNKVENLRWCTSAQNTEYYNTKDGRRWKEQQDKTRKAKLKAYHTELESLRKDIESREGELHKVENKIVRAQENLLRITKEVEDYYTHFEAYKQKELEKIQTANKNYHGYKKTKQVKFESVKQMVEETGKTITVDGKEFISCGSAAQYIMDNTEGKNKATISKELRRFLQGKRSAWVMYDQFPIGY